MKIVRSLSRLSVKALGVIFAISAWALPAVADGEIDHFTHVIRVAAELEVDGSRVAYDEYIECRPVRARNSVTIQIRRSYIAKAVPSGGAVVLHLPSSMCMLWHHTWNSAGRDRPELQLSTQHLPRVYWINDIGNPAFIEAYYSEAYHNQPKRRVRLLTFGARLAAYPVANDALQLARAQEKADPPMDVIHPRGCGTWCWRAMAFAQIREDEWRQVPEIARTIDSLSPGQGLVLLSADLKKLLDPFMHSRQVSWLLLERGVPRRGDDHGLIGVQPRSQLDQLWRDRLRVSADDLIPIRCEGHICRPLFGERGYVIFYRKEAFRSDEQFRWVEFQGTRIGVRDFDKWRAAIYDPTTRTVLIRTGAFR
jgi:hypothetical protein